MQRIEQPDSAQPVDHAAEEEDVAEEDARDDNQWGNHEHDRAVGDLLQRVELPFRSWNERIFTSLEYAKEIVERLLPQDWNIRRPRDVMNPEATANQDIEHPEEEGEGHRIAEVLMDQDGHTVFGDPEGHPAGELFDPRRPELDAGNHQRNDDQRIDPVPYSNGQRM